MLTLRIYIAVHKRDMVSELRNSYPLLEKDIIHINCTYNYEQTIVYNYRCYKRGGETECCEKV